MLEIYTDGGCHGNPGVGAWAFVVYDALGHKIGTKSNYAEEITTNIRMEMQAILEALKFVNKHKKKCEILTDSKFSIDAITKWLPGWKRRGWKKASGEPVANQDLWELIDRELQQYFNNNSITVTLTHVKGHSGIQGNEEADELTQIRISDRELDLRM
ncbi:putative ribonuclease H [Proteus phage 2]|nr:ribonuclease H [Proteus phage 1]QNN97865.1 putative ribonuclease H [Proteus phage 2]QOC54973.1 putative ribonuclease H [Proteus phage M4H10_20]